ncbi:alpha-ketoglutarate-dependent dioxygenase AlkB [Patescibacteria group bacterium]|nr:alpha-ketoglutarate-dependent dioxygenase AlkB [Patescibacteria group bacterium]
MTRSSAQPKLFDLPETLPNGLVYRPDFLTSGEEDVLLAYIQNLPLFNAPYKEYTAKRRILNFGWSFDFRNNKLIPGPPLPKFLTSTQRKIAKWLQIPEHCVAEALITEYSPGTQLGWHVDNEEFDKIVGVSLGSWSKIRFRPLSEKENTISIELEPRSAYIMQSEVRWQWQHSVAPVPDLRYSITFRTLPA